MNQPTPYLDLETLRLLDPAVRRLAESYGSLAPGVPLGQDESRVAQILDEVSERMRDNFPYFHPLYAGQMLKPPHPVARLAYSLALWINPNNHALDGGRASSAMEREAVADLARMIGWDTHLGHLAGGGTMANLEALWVGGQLNPGKLVLASAQAHYTHSRISAVLGLPFEPVPADSRGRLSLPELRRLLDTRPVGTLVATLGATATGAVDPLPQLLPLQTQYGFRLHVDAAYGGYFTLAGNLEAEARAAFDALPQADSLVIDPHKHGLQPYGCGCVLFRDPAVGRFYRHNSPYTYFTSGDLHLGEIGLECSRPGAAAVALWATQRMFPLTPDGKFAEGLTAGRAAALEFYARLKRDARFVVAEAPELDIVAWAVRGRSGAAASESAKRIFAEAARRGLHLALADLPVHLLAGDGRAEISDQPTVTFLRSVLMKPEHREWLPRIWEILDQATDAALQC
jgi:glutamate/tyrosine decarboxylase-like PLP-dependent enzyme